MYGRKLSIFLNRPYVLACISTVKLSILGAVKRKFCAFLHFFVLFLQKNLQNKKFALPLHSQYSNGGFI